MTVGEQLFNRDFALQLGTKRIAMRPIGDKNISKPMLKVIFNIEKSTDRDPNKATITVHNLAERTRKELQKEQPVIVQAGYTNTIQQIFSGDITYISHAREGVDWVTTLQCNDGARQYVSARLSVSFGPGTQFRSLLQTLAEALGVGLGNAQGQFTAGDFRGGLVEFTKGVVVSGKVSDILDKYVTTAGFKWSLQDGQLQILKPGQTTTEELVVLTKDSGLIGSPEVGEEGIVSAKSLLQGTIRPGRRIRIESLEVDGTFKIERVSHVGDSWGTDWYTELEAKPLQ